jgi:peptidoglycan hydrolase-like protein with peptidoglycan-binding domain
MVAEMAGVSLGAVRNYRTKMGIAASGRTPAAPVPAAPTPSTPVIVPAAAAGQSMQVWRVLLEGEGKRVERIVVGPTLIEAAAIAERVGKEHYGLNALSIELVGQLLD